ncbi:hypothetical protein [Serinicoccus sediminis]|uniref:hypothetical protein n=1 Tax=Serinicoccus sediminis TaxID=2306021 RepID=UPI001020EE75|nr:hypothetical protein [Serinicoccus sediminis]
MGILLVWIGGALMAVGLVILLVGIFMPREGERAVAGQSWFREFIEALLTRIDKLYAAVLRARTRRRQMQALGSALLQTGFYVLVIAAAVVLFSPRDGGGGTDDDSSTTTAALSVLEVTTTSQ